MAKEKALLKERSLPDEADDVNAATIKAELKQEKRKQYYLNQKETINYQARLRRAKNKEICRSNDLP